MKKRSHANKPRLTNEERCKALIALIVGELDAGPRKIAMLTKLERLALKTIQAAVRDAFARKKRRED